MAWHVLGRSREKRRSCRIWPPADAHPGGARVGGQEGAACCSFQSPGTAATTTTTTTTTTT
eukprot:260816-Heterocapsa_arctica.AAC.1